MPKLPEVFVRNVTLNLREGKNGPEQYARIVLHAEIPTADVQAQIFSLSRLQKGPIVLDASEAQLSLPTGVAAANAPAAQAG
jgi:hypothetical protein